MQSSSQTEPKFVEHINSVSNTNTASNLKEVWEYKSILYYLIIRDIKVRYKQTVLGLSWVVINPIITMVVFTFVFGKLADVPSYDVPYPLFSFAALVPWTLFSRGLIMSSTSVVGNSAIVTKVYFPRLVLPIAAFLTAFVDFVLALLVLLIMMLIVGYVPTVNSIWLPFYILLLSLAGLGLGFWFSAIQVRARDINYLMPFLLQTWIYITPVAYPSSLLNAPWSTLYSLNPMVAVCDGFRWALLGIDTFHPTTVVLSAFSALLLFISGMGFFLRAEPTFADII